MLRAKAGRLLAGAAAAAVMAFGVAYGQQGPRGKSSYMPVDIDEPFSAIFSRLSGEKPQVTREHMAVLAERYDLSDRPAAGVAMDRSKPVQEGVRVKLPAGKTWTALADMSPEEIRDQNAFPKGFYPLPHPKHREGGFVFPHFVIDEMKRQEGRDLTRFDVDYDIPDHFLPEFPPPMYLNQRTDLGDVTQGKLVTIENYYELFNGIIPPKQLEGLRLLVTRVPAAAIQSDGGSTFGEAQPWRSVLRLPLERSHQQGHTPRSRCPSGGIAPSDRYSDITRGANSAFVRFAARAQDH